MFITFVMFYQFISNDLIFIQTKIFCRSSAKVRNCKIMRKEDSIFCRNIG